MGFRVSFLIIQWGRQYPKSEPGNKQSGPPCWLWLYDSTNTGFKESKIQLEATAETLHRTVEIPGLTVTMLVQHEAWQGLACAKLPLMP